MRPARASYPSGSPALYADGSVHSLPYGYTITTTINGASVSMNNTGTMQISVS